MGKRVEEWGPVVELLDRVILFGLVILILIMIASNAGVGCQSM